MQLSFDSVSTERLQAILPKLAALLLTVLIGLQAAQLTWLLIPAPEQGSWTPRPPPAPAIGQQAASQSQFDIQPLLAAKPFGEFTTEQVAPVASTVDAPETNLRLKLRGIFAMEDSRLSRALIEASNGQLESYALGSSIPGGATLHAIFVDRVLLQRGGRLETLRLEKDEPGRGVVSSQDNRSRHQAGSAARVLDSGTAAKLSNIREELLNDPTKASNYLRVQPARSNGQMKGYRIYPGRNRDLFREAGLRPGDIVTAINGVTLNDPSRSLQLLSDLSSATQVNIQIERGGQPQSLSVNLN